MLHPIMIAIVVVNTSITVLYWVWIISDACQRHKEEKAKDNPV